MVTYNTHERRNVQTCATMYVLGTVQCHMAYMEKGLCGTHRSPCSLLVHFTFRANTILRVILSLVRANKLDFYLSGAIN